VQAGEGSCVLCLVSHDRHASQLRSGELAGSGQLSPGAQPIVSGSGQ
jgi:hypothetical protein